MNKKILILFVVILTFSLLHSVQVRKREVKDYNSFEKGTFKDTGLKNSGELFISLKSSRIKGPGKEYYLGGDISKSGDIYLGTGHNASLYRIGKDGKSTEMFKAQEPDIYAVMYGSDKLIYAASSPRGKLFRISGPDKAKEFFNPDEKYIWDLKEDRSGNIICAVGGSGGVYKIDKNGNSKKIFSGDTHIMSLFVSADNSILAGSGGSGILYRINSGKSRVLYDTPFEEINGIYGDDDGDVWFSASKEVKKGKPGSITMISRSFPKVRAVPEEKSILYLRHAGGEVEVLWSSPDEQIYSLAPDKKNGGVLIGTGNRGRIYRVKKDGSFSMIYEGESAQPFRILPGAESFTVIYNNTSSIVKLDNLASSKGSYISEVFNLGIQSNAGRLYWDSLNGKSNSVSFFVRSGNTASPDSTWTEWSPPFNDGDNSNINREGYKYFQIKVNLNSSPGDKNPGISGFRFFYVQKNLKPEVKRIKIGIPYQPKKNPNLKKPVVIKKNTLQISWYGDDPNKDELKYSLYLKKISGRQWISFKKDITNTKAELNTELYEDGEYILKVTADDSLSNSPDTFRTDTGTSKKFTIDSTAPILSGFQSAGGFLTFRVSDKNSVILKVLYSLTGDKWFPLDPVDKINDSGNENFKLSKKFTKGKKLIFFKITDEHKNSKVFQKEL
ncbi:MAG: hypothetical protein ABFR36_01035 [Acidobacteriota bacterium]